MNPEETVLWEGDPGPTPPWYRRLRETVVPVLPWLGYTLVMLACWAWTSNHWLGYLILWAVVTVALVVLSPLLGRHTISRGHYTLTDRRLLVDGRRFGFPVHRAENLADLHTPQLREDGSITFGGRETGDRAGLRPNKSVIHSLLLYRIADPEHVLELLRKTQAREKAEN